MSNPRFHRPLFGPLRTSKQPIWLGAHGDDQIAPHMQIGMTTVFPSEKGIKGLNGSYQESAVL